MDAASVMVSFPASPSYLQLARLAAADAGSRAGFDFEEIDDLRIAVSELCILLLDSDATMQLEFVQAGPNELVVVGTAAAGGALELDDLSRAIVEAVVDEYELTSSDGVGRFRLLKRRGCRLTRTRQRRPATWAEACVVGAGRGRRPLVYPAAEPGKRAVSVGAC